MQFLKTLFATLLKERKRLMSEKIALLLSGGGARGAYQAGVIRALSDILPGDKLPFSILSGISAGAINACYLAANANDFSYAARGLSNLWSELRTEQVIDTSLGSFLKNAFLWFWDSAFGGIHGQNTVKSLLDTAPLRELINKNVSFDRIAENLAAGLFDSFSVTATNYSGSNNVAFVESRDAIKHWQRSRRYSVASKITIDHIMASSALPLLFMPVKIGDDYYGDGFLRNMAPISPTVRLGAEKILILGVRFPGMKITSGLVPTTGRVLGSLLNAALLDGMDTDLERMDRFNEIYDEHLNQTANNALRPIRYLYLHPSQDLAELAIRHVSSMPSIMKFLLRGLGSHKDGSELLSYLNFESDYCSECIRLGYRDTLARAEEIKNFLKTDESFEESVIKSAS